MKKRFENCTLGASVFKRMRWKGFHFVRYLFCESRVQGEFSGDDLVEVSGSKTDFVVFLVLGVEGAEVQSIDREAAEGRARGEIESETNAKRLTGFMIGGIRRQHACEPGHWFRKKDRELISAC